MNTANVETFLENLLMDSEGSGVPIPGKPGFVLFDMPQLTEEDLKLRCYNEEEWKNGGKLSLDAYIDGEAYVAATATLLLLRRRWRESHYLLYQETPEGAISTMVDDISNVVGLLQSVATGLRSLSNGEAFLDTALQSARKAAQEAQEELAEAKAKMYESKTRVERANHNREMFRLLQEVPMEQLARLGIESVSVDVSVNNNNNGQGA